MKKIEVTEIFMFEVPDHFTDEQISKFTIEADHVKLYDGEGNRVKEEDTENIGIEYPVIHSGHETVDVTVVTDFLKNKD